MSRRPQVKDSLPSHIHNVRKYRIMLLEDDLEYKGEKLVYLQGLDGAKYLVSVEEFEENYSNIAEVYKSIRPQGTKLQ